MCMRTGMEKQTKIDLVRCKYPIVRRCASTLPAVKTTVRVDDIQNRAYRC